MYEVYSTDGFDYLRKLTVIKMIRTIGLVRSRQSNKRRQQRGFASVPDDGFSSLLIHRKSSGCAGGLPKFDSSGSRL